MDPPTQCVDVQRHPEQPSLSRWACTLCGWHTRWVHYHDPTAGPAAIRHQTDHHRDPAEEPQ